MSSAVSKTERSFMCTSSTPSPYYDITSNTHEVKQIQ